MSCGRERESAHRAWKEGAIRKAVNTIIEGVQRASSCSKDRYTFVAAMDGNRIDTYQVMTIFPLPRIPGAGTV